MSAVPVGEIDLGRALRVLRSEAGLSMEELARRSRVSQGQISGLEKNVKWPSRAALTSLARELGRDPAFVLCLAAGVVVDRDPVTGEVRSATRWTPGVPR